MDEPLLLLVESDSHARVLHECILSAAGYAVISTAACPEVEDVQRAALILSDIPSSEWLREQRIRSLPPIVAIAGDPKGGVTACLCGAAAWVPADGAGVYLLDTVHEVLHAPGAIARSAAPR